MMGAVTSLARRAYRIAMHGQRAAMSRLPPNVAAGIDRVLPVVVRPMNGQAARQDIVRQLHQALTVDRVLETGTYRGGTTEFLADTFNVPVRSVEASPRYFAYASNRLRADVRIRLSQGDSRTFLREQAERVARRKESGAAPETVFFYLDAHWENDLPLAEELAIIAGAWERAVVMVDDFEVPGDSGYGFDDYGPGKALTESYLPPVVSDWATFYPATPSASETGARRGCVVLASPGIGDLSIPGLRPAG
jgi:hypothetical protein